MLGTPQDINREISWKALQLECGFINSVRLRLHNKVMQKQEKEVISDQTFTK
jgi:hypothetical protein